MKLLVITYYYSPMLNPRAFRWKSIAEYWTRQGHRVDVVCSLMPGLLREEILNGVHVHRVGSTITEKLKKSLGKTDMNSFDGNRCNKSARLINDRWLTRFAKWIYDQTWKKLYWPDHACLWYFPALKKVQQLMKVQDYDGIVTISHPFTGHLVGLRIKKRCQKIKWLVDIGDPFCFLEKTPLNNQQLYKPINYLFEHKVFSRADALSVTTKPTLEKYAELFPENAQKIQVIPPLLSWPEDQTSEGSLFSDEQKLRLVYVGTLYKRVRSPDYCLKIFDKLLQTKLSEKIELHFFGSIHDCQDCFEDYKAKLDKKIFIHGKVSRSQTLQAMKKADCLVNIGNYTPYQLPSKVVEYVSTGKPILNIVNIANDSSLAFFENYTALFTMFNNQEEAGENNFDKLLNFLENLPSVRSDENKVFTANFEVKSIAKQYEFLLKK
ncbi:MAG: glycosyltransferase [Xenococcaceae cyanobacterium]